MSDQIYSYEIVPTPAIIHYKGSKYAPIVKAVAALPAGKSLKLDATPWLGRKSHPGEPIRTACVSAGLKVSIQHDKGMNVLFVTRIGRGTGPTTSCSSGSH